MSSEYNDTITGLRKIRASPSLPYYSDSGRLSQPFSHLVNSLVETVKHVFAAKQDHSGAPNWTEALYSQPLKYFIHEKNKLKKVANTFTCTHTLLLFPLSQRVQHSSVQVKLPATLKKYLLLQPPSIFKLAYVPLSIALYLLYLKPLWN